MAGVLPSVEVDGATEATPSHAIAAPAIPAALHGPLNRAIGRVDRAGWRGAGPFLALFLVQLAWAHAVLWASDRVPVGSVDAYAVVLSLYAPYSLAALLVAGRVARRCLVTFWPATGRPLDEQPAWIHRFSGAPARLEAVAFAIGLAVGIGVLFSAPEALLGPGDRATSLVAYVPVFVLSYIVSAVVLATIARWLWFVDRLHRDATALDPWDRGPVYAFSRFTVVVGVGAALPAYVSYVATARYYESNAVGALFAVSVVAISLIAFVAPLWSIHDRLVDEKRRLVAEVEGRIARTADELYGRIDVGAFEETKAIGEALGGLNVLRERIQRLPTWPWPPQLLRGFLTALLLPIAIYVVTRAISALSGI
jgi:putative flippase GtrA